MTLANGEGTPGLSWRAVWGICNLAERPEAPMAAPEPQVPRAGVLLASPVPKGFPV